MKKITNKILIIASIIFLLLVAINITIDFQLKRHMNPEQMFQSNDPVFQAEPEADVHIQ